MKVYIDLVIIMNFLFDFILLSSVNYILKRNSKIGRRIVSSLFGEITTLLLFIKINNLELIVFKIIVSIVMILICFEYRDIRYVIKNIIYFYLVSMLLGGGIEFLINNIGDGSYSFSFYYLVIVIIAIFLFIKFIVCINGLKVHYNNYYPAKLYINEEDYINVIAFLDTGNMLIDPYSKKGIVLLDNKKYDFSLFNPIYVPYNTLNNHGMLKCYKVWKLEIEGRCIDKILVGISNDKLFLDGIDCIISTKIMEGLQ